jgi:hypothetical protein
MTNWIGVPLAEFDKEAPELPLTDSYSFLCSFLGFALSFCLCYLLLLSYGSGPTLRAAGTTLRLLGISPD